MLNPVRIEKVAIKEFSIFDVIKKPKYVSNKEIKKGIMIKNRIMPIVVVSSLRVSKCLLKIGQILITDNILATYLVFIKRFKNNIDIFNSVFQE